MRVASHYAYQIDGPRPSGQREWHAFDPQKGLLDPYARAAFLPPGFDRQAARRPGSKPGPGAAWDPAGLKSQPSIWGDDRPPRHESDAVIYEMHVRGFTRSLTSGLAPERRGTYSGLVEKIPHLRELGVTIVELLPVQQFDPQEGNYWGYMTLNLFAAHQEYAVDPHHVRDEFRAMVRALHQAGIEVILDVVYNHTAEAGHRRADLQLSGNRQHRLLPHGRRPRAPYVDYTGCGNTLACSR